MKGKFTFKTLLVAAGLVAGSMSAWATDWTTVWSTDFSSEPSGLTYSISRGDISISTGVLRYGVGMNNGCSTYCSFTDSKFNVETDWNLEFDWNGSSSNTDASNVTFATDKGNVFTISWAKNATTASVVDANSTTLTETLPIAGYNKGSMSCDDHIVVTGDPENGIYLTITSGETTYVDNVLVSSTFGYPASFNGTLGRYVSHMAIDNIIFQTPTVAGYVSAPVGTITGAVGNARKFTLSCLTEGVTMYYSETDIEVGAAGWTTYSAEVTTSATTIYTYAKDGSDNISAKESFATGAESIVPLEDASIAHTAANQYTISNDQTTVLGRPTATIHYQVDGGTEQTTTNASVNVSITQDGTLTYWLTAEGYGATEPKDENVYAALATKIEADEVDFCTSNSNDWSSHGDEVTVEGDDTHTFYKYKDQSGNIVSDGLLAVTFANATIDNSWRIQKSYGGTQAYNAEAFIALIGLEKGQIVQVKCNGAPTSTTNLSVIEGDTYTGTFSYRVDANGNAIFNIPKNSVIKTIGIYNDKLNATVTSAGWSTFYTPYALDFSGIEGLTAYIATYDAGEATVTLNQVDDVPANTGVVLKGAADTYAIPVKASAENDEQGSLSGNATAATAYDAFDGYTIYVLTKDGENDAQFNPMTSDSVAAGKAFLKVSSSEARPIKVVFADESTGIAAIDHSPLTIDHYYNLNGQRISAPQKGLYIKDGKKVIIK